MGHKPTPIAYRRDCDVLIVGYLSNDMTRRVHTCGLDSAIILVDRRTTNVGQICIRRRRVALSLAIGAASAADKVPIQLKWVTQSQFAGDARKNPDEAAKIVLATGTTGANRKAPRRMMGEIAKLLDTREGKLDPKDYERTVATLMSGGSDPVIHQEAGRRLDPRHLRCHEINSQGRYQSRGGNALRSVQTDNGS